MSSRDSAPGTVAVIFSSEAARYSEFSSDLEALDLPEGSVKDFAFGSDHAELRNELVERALARGSYWVWFITEDHSFLPDIVQLMLLKNEPLVAPIVLGREAPFYPLAYAEKEDAGGYKHLMLDSVTGPGTLTEVRAAKATGMLIRRAVFESMQTPWYKSEFRVQGSLDDEMAFCERARDLGFQAYVDTSARLGNRCTATMYPIYKGAKWELAVGVGTEIELSVPIKHP